MMLLWVSTLVFASPTATTVAKNGSCPSNYSSSGNYCKPSSGAKFAIEKNGSCPSNYSSSGNYCLANSNASLVMHKSGSCPSGYSSSGNYCVAQSEQRYSALTPINSCQRMVLVHQNSVVQGTIVNRVQVRSLRLRRMVPVPRTTVVQVSTVLLVQVQNMRYTKMVLVHQGILVQGTIVSSIENTQRTVRPKICNNGKTASYFPKSDCIYC